MNKADNMFGEVMAKKGEGMERYLMGGNIVFDIKCSMNSFYTTLRKQKTVKSRGFGFILGGAE